jgi:Ca2+-dependent lipid-binding protein
MNYCRGKGDPYVIIRFNNEDKRTSTVKDTLKPNWNEGTH